MIILKKIKEKSKFILILCLCVSMLFSNIAFAATDDDVGDASTDTSSDTSTLVNGQAVADYACQFIGNPYVWGGTSLTNGCDCSGFVQQVYAHFGIDLPHGTEYLREVGTPVTWEQMQPGDVINFNASNSGIRHTGIYVGNGEMVHAKGSAYGIVRETVTQSYHNGVYNIVRLVDSDMSIPAATASGELREYLKDCVRQCYNNDMQKMLTRSTSGFYATGLTEYPAYGDLLSDEDLSKIAAVCETFSSDTSEIKEIASLIANRYELDEAEESLMDYIKNDPYFSDAYASSSSSANEERDTDAVKDVLVNGNRSLPSNVNKFDVFDEDYINIPNPDSSEDYVQGSTVVTGKDGENYTFWIFSGDNENGQFIFGYTEEDVSVVMPDTNPIGDENAGEVKIKYNYITEDGSYYNTYKDHNEFLQTTNSAEILAMAYTYYDLNIGFSNTSIQKQQEGLAKVNNFIIALYSASHEITVTTDNMTIDRHTGEYETVEEKTATCLVEDDGQVCGEVIPAENSEDTSYKLKDLKTHLSDAHGINTWFPRQYFEESTETVDKEIIEKVLVSDYDYVYNTYLFPDLFTLAQEMQSTSYSSKIVDETYQIGLDLDYHEVPDNESNNPVVYYSQGTDTYRNYRPDWADLEFGGGTISSAGCSITAIAMVISYLNSGTDSSGWVTPGGVRYSIMENNSGNYNAFWAGDGQYHYIVSDVAGYFGYSCDCIFDRGDSSTLATDEQIEQAIKALKSGYPIVAVCHAPSLFTNNGHFIVITGINDKGEFTVNDPSHASYSYQTFTRNQLFGSDGTKNTGNINGMYVIH